MDIKKPVVPTALARDKEITKSILQLMAAVNIVQGIDTELWRELLVDATTELFEVTIEIANESKLGGLTNPEAQLRIAQLVLRIEFLEIYVEQLQNTLPIDT